MKRNPNAGLFSGYWTRLDGTKIRRIRRDEYPELYRLHRLCSEQEASVEPLSRRWLPVEGGYAEISFPGVPRFVESWQEGPTKAPLVAAASVCRQTAPAARAS